MKNAKAEKSIFTLINEPRTGLQGVVARLRQLTHLNQLLKTFLANSTLHEHCQVVNLRANSLVIAADSASWCTLLRYECPRLLNDYRQAGVYSLQSITCQVQTPDALTTSEKSFAKKPPLLSQDNAAFLLDMAQYIEHPRLRAALERLAGSDHST